jgi:hypothetical protein
MVKEIQQREWSSAEVEVSLYRFGLKTYEVELVMMRYISGKKMRDIVETQGWVSVSSANYHLKKVMAKLRKGRFHL